MATTCKLVDGVVTIGYTGTVTPAELLETARTAHGLSRGMAGPRLFADLTQLRGGHTPIDLLAVIDLAEALGFPRSMREALLLPPGAVAPADVQFYEDACQNRGWNVRIFQDRGAALAWLREA